MKRHIQSHCKGSLPTGSGGNNLGSVANSIAGSVSAASTPGPISHHPAGHLVGGVHNHNSQAAAVAAAAAAAAAAANVAAHGGVGFGLTPL